MQVVARSCRGGAVHLTIVQFDGTLAKIPSWMTEAESGEAVVARDMVLAHHRRQPALLAAVEIAKPAVAIAIIRMRGAIFFPQQRERDILALQLAVNPASGGL